MTGVNLKMLFALLQAGRVSHFSNVLVWPRTEVGVEGCGVVVVIVFKGEQDFVLITTLHHFIASVYALPKLLFILGGFFLF